MFRSRQAITLTENIVLVLEQGKLDTETDTETTLDIAGYAFGSNKSKLGSPGEDRCICPIGHPHHIF